DCKEHFESVKKYLDAMNIEYTVNPQIVRGLDYYTRTVFEFVSKEIGAQGTVCGGGRYDGLIAEMGGNPLPACGFGLGLERLLLLMEAQKTPFPEPKKCDLYIASMGENANLKAAEIATELRNEGMCVQFDTVGRGLKPQMKYANKIGALYTLVLGDNEIETGNIKLKNMESGVESEMTLNDFADKFQAKVISDAMAGFESLGVEGIDLSDLLGGNN
ncbi:MAG: ATP phosphoribosyltransferase regulatory subunit, partial [Clostridia bacterium]|nr:ATP phosphoribosyltransferase regulatory subunit [Clostridia bacterium]